MLNIPFPSTGARNMKVPRFDRERQLNERESLSTLVQFVSGTRTLSHWFLYERKLPINQPISGALSFSVLAQARKPIADETNDAIA